MEKWKAIPGWEGMYEVSSEGRVKSLRTRKFLRQPVDVSGYPRVYLSRAGAKKSLLVHRLVLIAFKGMPGENLDGCHNNGIPTDNRLENLRWDSRFGNERDKVKHGTHNRGERHPCRKLTDDDVRAIRASSEPLKVLANRHSVAESTVCQIRKGVRWTHI